MPEQALGANFSIDITDLRAGLAQANRLIRESESQFREVAAGMDDWSNSQKGLEARTKTLNTQIDLQKKKVAALTAEKKRIVAQMQAEGRSNEEIERAVDGVNKQIARESTQLDRLNRDLNKTETALADFADESEDAAKEAQDVGNAADNAGEKFQGLKNAAGVAAGAIAAVGAAAAAAIGGFFGLAESTRESRAEMGKLETAFTNVGLTAQNAENAFTELYGVLGDEGRAVESASFLAQYADDEKELAEQTRILTGVFATYGESIPTEGLAEGIAATIAMGETQGVLADALEWQGINLEDFNAQLATLGSEKEREALITKTLNGLYGEAADKYKEVNADVIAAQEAQAGLTQAMNDLGAIAEPIMTTLKTAATDLLVSITPFVEMMGDGFAAAMAGADGAAAQLASGLSGVLGTALDTVTNALPVALETIVELLPQLVTMLLSTISALLPTILELITDFIPQITDTLLSALPGLVSFLLNEALPQILDALGQMVPQLLQQIVTIVPQLVSLLLESVPTVLAAATQLLMAIVDALPILVEQLVSALPSVIDSFISALLSSFPILLQAAIQLFNAIISAIPVLIRSLTQNLPKIINSIIDGLLNALPLLLDAAVTLLMAVIQAIPTIAGLLYKEIPQLVMSIVSSLVSKIPDLYKGALRLYDGLLQAIPQIARELAGKVPELVTTVLEGLRSGFTGVKKIGGDLIRGLWDGISNMTDWIGKKIKGFGDNVLNGLKDFFGIESPSRVMADVVGKNLALGIGEGFEDNINDVVGDMNHSMRGFEPKVAATVRGTSGGSAGGVNVYQTNNYSQAHSRYELYKSRQDAAAAVRLVLQEVN